jgi:hypothetical protein
VGNSWTLHVFSGLLFDSYPPEYSIFFPGVCIFSLGFHLQIYSGIWIFAVGAIKFGSFFRLLKSFSKLYVMKRVAEMECA